MKRSVVRQELFRECIRRARAALGCVGLLAIVCWSASVAAQPLDPVRASLKIDRAAVHAGESFTLGLQLEHAPGWHTYWRNPGEAGLATQVTTQGPDGIQTDALQWPTPRRYVEGDLGIYGYADTVVLPWAMRLPAEWQGSVAELVVSVQWLACRELCVPGEARFTLSVPRASPADHAVQSAAQAEWLIQAQQSIPVDRPGLTVLWHHTTESDGQASLTFVAPELSKQGGHVEFFPAREGVLRAAAPQTLIRTSEGWRLNVASATPKDSGAISGILVVNGRGFAVQARSVDQHPPMGVKVAVAHPERPLGITASRLGAESQVPEPSQAAVPDAWHGSAWVAIGFASLGGLLLNLMPCVFPVIGLKVMGFARMKGAPNEREATRRGAIAFALGVVMSFVLLAGGLLALRAAGVAVGWGFQLQSPGFVILMTGLFLGLGLNFSGVFEWGHGLTRWAGRLSAGRDDLIGAWGTGCLAVMVATPCTAPFMGSAIGLALVQSPAVAIAVFAAMGVGMAFPYLLLSWHPAALRALPRPGPWMVVLRQSLAFPMYASAAWLVWVLGQQLGLDAVLRLLLAAVGWAMVLWLWGQRASGWPVRVVAGTGLLVLIVWLHPLLRSPALPSPTVTDSAPADSLTQPWAPWSVTRVAQARAVGQPVLIDFTAAWCVTCQVNKVLVLQRDSVTEALARHRVRTFRADWTARDPAITAELARYGRQGVPLYVLYRPDEAEPRILPAVLTVGVVFNALTGL